jgi:hypothetical protein
MKGRHARKGTAPREMKVECGDFAWKGSARSLDDAVISAFARSSRLPKNPSLLLRVWDGVWQYIDFIQALKIAGYNVRKTKLGWKIV